MGTREKQLKDNPTIMCLREKQLKDNPTMLYPYSTHAFSHHAWLY